MTITRSILDSWVQHLQSHATTNENYDPSYYASLPQTLITTSQPANFSLGAGSQLLSNVFSDCLTTNQELLIVTCFWAKSSSQESIFSLLLKLSAKAVAQDRKIQVRICFSSRSLAQKLFQTSSLDGKIYKPSSWVSLGLPDPESLLGLELVVKSVFVRPFSVMHPKFILVDRQLAFMLSCNVSWENWFEGYIKMRGEICEKLLNFWFAFWSRGEAPLPLFSNSTSEPRAGNVPEIQEHSEINRVSFSSTIPPIPTVLLPSPHRSNPNFRPFWLSPPQVPPTPLNTFLLHIFATAKSNIFIQTPNVTSAPLIEALFSALKLGVNIHLVTSSRLMILEQLVTAGTITEFELWKLRRKHKSLFSAYTKVSTADFEAQPVKPGALRIGYFHPKLGSWDSDEPVKSHLKCVIVDEEITVLGSGNMDRASWFTSQELGVAFLSSEMAKDIKGCVEEGLEGRVDYVC
jgi:phosphatidylserine/phosphatidylglycerophosphate/cardiolipin synthase-like enzyme